MQREDRGRDDEAWRAIVENYGDRVELDDPEPSPDPSAGPASPAFPGSAAEPFPSPGPAPYDAEQAEQAEPDPDRFVAPDPPLPPRPTRDRLAAWAGLIGSPVVLLVLVLTGIDIPELLAYALVAGFIGGFLYLVLHLPRSPEDPWDDGARL